MAKKQPEDFTLTIKDDPYYKRVLEESEVNARVAGKEPTEDNLFKEADRLTGLVAEISNSQVVTHYCDMFLDTARGWLKRGITDNALDSFNEVKRRLLVAYESRKAWPKWILILFGMNTIYLFLIGFLIGWYALIPGQKNLESTAFVCLACALWAGLGGVVDAFIAIVEHHAKQDFDLHYRTWYFVHPIQGAALGAVIYLLIQAGLLAVSGASLQEGNTANATGVISQAAATRGVGATALPIAVAFLVGFRQDKARKFLTRIVSVILEKSTDESGTTTPGSKEE